MARGGTECRNRARLSSFLSASLPHPPSITSSRTPSSFPEPDLAAPRRSVILRDRNSGGVRQRWQEGRGWGQEAGISHSCALLRPLHLSAVAAGGFMLSCLPLPVPSSPTSSVLASLSTSVTSYNPSRPQMMCGQRKRRKMINVKC